MSHRLGIAMKFYGWIGLTILFVSEIFLFQKIDPFYSWFYCFAWWSYILLADNLLLKLRGTSLLTTRRNELWHMLALSVFIWLLFEAYNLRINNWHYEGVPSRFWIRWFGYIFSFATVLPGIFITSDLVEYVLGGRGRFCSSENEGFASGSSSRPPKAFLPLGLFLCVAPLLWPRYFFPTVWLGPIFLVDPFLERLGVQSLWSARTVRGGRKIWSLLLGGFACGLMWEFWNYWSASKWVYTVPFFENWKVFEMPALGFFGFPPFALECWSLYQLLLNCLKRTHSTRARLALWLIIALICAAILRAIDSNTVTKFAESNFRSLSICGIG
jgi:hypothetical protein